ncbi:MAG: DUF4372 domain-containing protein [Nitrosomonas sp.]|nr:DUF4372 domain-containing protein [Nitrosomonas sp.]MDO9469762.1 DUF4372 domain-containing protein [Nitrosomonas sp.]MDP2224704.1 DUF4372 domain-containing protein [Nitrosomonas sp.]
MLLDPLEEQLDLPAAFVIQITSIHHVESPCRESGSQCPTRYFSHFDQFLCMAFTYLTYHESLLAVTFLTEYCNQ